VKTALDSPYSMPFATRIATALSSLRRHAAMDEQSDKDRNATGQRNRAGDNERG
jgi:hypothetical protein